MIMTSKYLEISGAFSLEDVDSPDNG